MPEITAPPPSIGALTRAMVRGDEAAYRMFHGLYVDRLARYLLVVSGGNEHAMRDALAETLRRTVKHIRRFEEEAVFWSWLTVVARTAYFDEQRQSRRYFSFLERFARYRVPETAVREADEAVRERLRQAVSELDEEDRMLVEWKYDERWSVRDIAARLGVTESSVESRLVRIRRKLKQQLLEQTE